MILWLKDRKTLGLLALTLALSATAYGFGRYSQPTKTLTTTTSTSSTATASTAQLATHVDQAPVKTTIVQRKRPAQPAQAVAPGQPCPACPPIDETTTTIEAGPVETTTAATLQQFVQQEQAATTTKLVEHDAPRLTLLAGVGMNATRPGQLVWSGDVLWRVAGPVTLGAYGDSTLTFLLKAGVSL